MSTVVLYSGGLDSYMAYHLLRRSGADVSAVYVSLGTRYTRKELDNLPLLDVPYSVLHLPLGDFERDDAFVPQRNTLLMTLAQAAFDADEVVLAAVQGEFSRDKHPEFFRRLSKTLSYSAGKPVVCRTPFAELTKSQALGAYLAAGLPAGPLYQTLSCYDPEQRACGKCMSCYRRWVALTNNDLPSEFAHPPADWIRQREQPSPGTLLALPVSQWLSFARAQVDAFRAHRRRR